MTAEGEEYDAFVSYSREAEEKLDLASKVTEALEQMGKPWRKRRALRVRLDVTSVPAATDGWAVLREGLDSARYFVLLASPKAAQSPWVDRELRYWIEKNGPSRILPILTDGHWGWDEERGGFAAADSGVDAVPPALREALNAEPFYADLRWVADEAGGGRSLDPGDPRFRQEVAKVSAAISGRKPSEVLDLDDMEFRKARRARRIAGGVGFVLVVALVAVAGLFAAARTDTEAERARAEIESVRADSESDRADTESVRADAEAVRADDETRAKLARDLATQSILADEQLPDLRLLTAVASDRLDQTTTSQAALLRALLAEPDLGLVLPGHADAVIDLKLSADGSVFATVDATGAARTWEASGPLLAGPLEVSATEVLLSSTGETLATVDRDGLIRWFDARTGEETHQEQPPDGAAVRFGCDSWGCARPLAGISPDGETVALAMRLDDGGYAVRFAGPGRAPVEVSVGGQITGLLWHGEDPLFVSDLEGVAAWDGEAGPVGGSVYNFTGAGVGILPGGAAFEPHGHEFAPLRDPTLALVTTEFDDPTPSVVKWISLDPDSGDWEVSGSSSAYGLGDRGFEVVPVGAIAAVGPGRVIIGSDPQEGGDPNPIAVDVGVYNARSRLFGWSLPSGAITRVAAHSDGTVALAGLDPVVRVHGGGRGIRTFAYPEMDEAPLGAGNGPMAVTGLPRDVDGNGLSYATQSGTGVYGAGIYGLDGTTLGSSVDRDRPYGQMRVVDANGDDMTPDITLGREVSAVIVDDTKPALYVGYPSGEVSRIDLLTGEQLESRRIMERPIRWLNGSLDGRFLVVATTEEMALVDPSTLTVIAVLAATAASDVLPDAMFRTPAMSATTAGFDLDGNLWFGWSNRASASVTTEFLSDEEEETPAILGVPLLPGSFGVVEDALSIRIALTDLAGEACAAANRDMTAEEWQRLVGELPRVEVCPDHPTPPAAVGEPLERYPDDDR